MQPTADEVTSALAEPFEAREVKWKPAVVSGNRAMALAYVDARVIQDRLDDVLGVVGWQDEYTILADGNVKCRLRCRIMGEWITKEDVGGESEQPDGGDRMKAAFSDSLKRAAVKFGIGRYLYRLPQQWCDYDPSKRQFVRPPTLPANAVKLASEPKAPLDPDVKRWAEFLATSPGADRLNAELVDDLAKIKSPKGKTGAWNLAKGYADKRGWRFDTEARTFVAPQEAPA